MNYDKSKVNEITDEFWEKYQKTHSVCLRNQIVMAYLYIVEYNAKKMQPIYKSFADIEEVVNQGALALIDCIEKYDYRRGIQFDSYASIRIRGSIIDYIRKQDWVPRGLRKKSIDIENTAQELRDELGRNPTDNEISKKLNTTPQKINKIRDESQRFTVLFYEELLQENSYGLKNDKDIPTFKTPDDGIINEELKKIIAEAVDTLGEKERTVISLYYVEELKQKEIAYVMGLTESRISQIHSKALVTIKKRIEKYLYN